MNPSPTHLVHEDGFYNQFCERRSFLYQVESFHRSGLGPIRVYEVRNDCCRSRNASCHNAPEDKKLRHPLISIIMNGEQEDVGKPNLFMLR